MMLMAQSNSVRAARFALAILSVCMSLVFAHTQDGTPANLADYARLNAVDGNTGQVLADAANLASGQGTPVALAPGNALSVEWSAPLELTDIRLQFQRPSPGVQLRVESWSEPATKAASNPTGTAGSRWETIPFEPAFDGASLVLKLRPTAAQDSSTSSPAPATVVTTRFLRVSSSALVLIERFAATGTARIRQARLRLDWDPNTSIPGKWSPRLEARFGRVISTASAGRNGLTAEVEFLDTPGRKGPDRGQIIFRSGEARSFAFYVDDALQAGGMEIRDLNVSIRRADAGLETRMPSIVISDAAPAVVQPPPSATALALGVPGLRQKFHVWNDGTIQLRTADLSSPGPDREARPWKWPDVHYQFGLGEHPAMGPTTNASAAPSLEDGWLPVVTSSRTNDGIQVVQTTLASTLLGDPADLNTTNGCEPAVLLAHVTLRNAAEAPRTVTLWLELSRSQPMRLSTDGSLVLVSPSDGYNRTNEVPIRAHFNTHGKGELDLAVLVPAAPGSYNPELHESRAARQALRYRVSLPPGATHAVDVLIPGLELLTLQQVSALKRLDYVSVHDAIARYWREQADAGMTLSVPDDRMNSLFRASLWRTLTAIELDPINGRSHLPNSSPSHRSLRQLAEVVTMLQSRGETRAARLLLDPLLASPADPFTAAATLPVGSSPAGGPGTVADTALEHAALVGAAARQFLVSRDPGWMRQSADRLVRASDWMTRRRIAWTQVVASTKPSPGSSRWQPPALSLSDVAWNANLLHAQQQLVAALTAIQHPEATRILREADSFRADLRAAALESVATSPVIRLSDGRFIPPLISDAHGAAAALPMGLFEQGVFATSHPFAAWMRAALEASAPTAPDLSAPVRGLDRQPLVSAALTRLLLRQEEPDLAFGALNKSFEALLDPGSPLARISSGDTGSAPTLPVVTECSLAQQLRDLMIMENADSLELLPGVPAIWLRDGARIQVQRAATRWGVLDIDARPGIASNLISIAVSLEATNRPRSILLHVRHPAGQPARSVTINGQPQPAGASALRMPLPSGASRWDVIVAY